MESIKLRNKYIDTKGVYDSTERKTQDQINAEKLNTANYNPYDKRPTMTKRVGKDSNGELWTEPVESSEVASATGAWLDENIKQETGYVIDKSLSTIGAAADAKATGDVKNAVLYSNQPLGVLLENKYVITEPNDPNIGNLKDYRDWSATDFIPVINTNVLIINSPAGGSGGRWSLFYDSNQTYIPDSSFQFNLGITSINVPPNAAYYRMSAPTAIMKQVTVKLWIANQLDTVNQLVLYGINGSKNQLTPRSTLDRQTNNGITFTPVYSGNNLQYISASGTATDIALYDIYFFISDGYYLLFQANSNNDTFVYTQEWVWSKGKYLTISNSNNKQIEPNIAKYSSGRWYRVRLRVEKGITVQNKIFCPILTRFNGDIDALKINYARELFKADSSFLTDEGSTQSDEGSTQSDEGSTQSDEGSTQYGIQSACYNPRSGNYFVFCGAIEKKFRNVKTLCIITKDITKLKNGDSNVDWKFFNIGHCNDCTYDPINDKIIAGGNVILGNGEKDVDNAITPNSVSIIDAVPGEKREGTLKSTVQLPGFPETDYITAIEFVNGFIYVAGIDDLYKYSFSWKDENNEATFKLEGIVGSMTRDSARQAAGTIYKRKAYGDENISFGAARQGMFFYGGYLYRIMHVYGSAESFGCLVQYTLDGIAVGCKAFPLNCNQDEIQTVVHRDGEIYALSGTSFFVKVIELSESQIQAPKYMALKEYENLNDVWIIGDYESRNAKLTEKILGRPTSLTTSFLMSVKQIGSQDLIQEIVAMPSKKYTRKYDFNRKAWTAWYVWETSATDTTVSSVE